MPPGAHPDAEPDFRALFDSAPCGLLLTDRDGLVLSANRTFCDWMGIDRDALVGKRRFQDLLSIGGRIFHQTHWAPLLQMQGSIAEVKLDMVTASNRLVPMVLNAVRRQEHERVVHQLALFVAEDRHAYERELLRARRGAEALLAEQTRVQEALALSDVRLRMALDTANLHIWEVDARTLERHYAPSIALLLGYPEPRAIAADEYIGAVEPHDRERAMEAFARVLDRTTDVYRCTYRIDGVDGRQRTVQASARALADPDGNIVRIVGLLQDISELEAQRVAAEDRALFAEQMIGIVSHDLRNPLSTIQMATTLLERAVVDEAQRRIVERVFRSTQRANRLLVDLLDFTQARLGGGIAIRKQKVDVHEV
ncbi:MAG TPA: PAS domain S-box protein, partial [Luteimonas sp.]|nr:PAS domain S-box protein [Luteimonas sp.]